MKSFPLYDIDSEEEWPSSEITDRRWPLLMDEKPVETMKHQFPQIRNDDGEYTVISGDCEKCERGKDEP